MQKMPNNILNWEEKATFNSKSVWAPAFSAFYSTLRDNGEIFMTEVIAIFPAKYIFCWNLWKSRWGSICSLVTEEE